MIPEAPTMLSGQALKEYFLSGCKAESDLQIGVEWEKIGVFRDTGKAIPYQGPRSVKTILELLCRRFGWTPVYSQDHEPIALKKGLSSITLEPGGQIELSGKKALCLHENADELYEHLAQIREVSEPLGITWLGIGAQPFSHHEEIEWVPKERYGIMRKSLEGHGALTYAMMKETASVQISLDYTSEADAVEKFRLSMALAPVLTALFANSPLERGERSSYLSRRAHIWTQTDPARTGVIWDAFDASFDLEAYTSYALQVPALFVQRNGEWLALPRTPFGEFIKKGWNGLSAEAQDWDLHLTSLFTEARLKKYIEIRSVDCQTTALGLSAVAFIKGIFYDAPARKAAWDLLKDWSVAERKELQKRAPVDALGTRCRNETLLEKAKALVGISEKGLVAEERFFLTPLKELLGTGRCPAQRLLECYSSASTIEARVKQVIRCAAV